MAVEGGLKVVTDADFDAATGAGVVLVDFYAEWCGPCRMQTPILEELSKELDGKASIVKLDIDNSQATTAKFQVTSVPTLILLKDGKEVQRIVGLRDADSLKTLIEQA